MFAAVLFSIFIKVKIINRLLKMLKIINKFFKTTRVVIIFYITSYVIFYVTNHEKSDVRKF